MDPLLSSANATSSLLADDPELEKELAEEERAEREAVNTDRAPQPDLAPPAPPDGDDDDLAGENAKLREQVENVNKALRQARAQGRDDRDFRERFSSVEQRITEVQNQLSQATTQGADVPDDLPDPDADPMGFLSAVRPLVEEVRTERRQERERAAQEQAQQQEQTQATQRLQRYLESAENDARLDHPDYDDAVNYYGRSRVSAIEAQGYTQQEALALYHQEAARLVVDSQQRGMSVAERIYNAARASGYDPNAVPEAEDGEADENPAPAQPSRKLQQMQRGRQMSPTMPPGGKPKKGANYAKKVDSLDPFHPDFDKAWDLAYEKGQL